MTTGHVEEMAARDWEERIAERARRRPEYRECTEECQRHGLATLDLFAPCICGRREGSSAAQAAAEAELLSEESRDLAERLVGGKIEPDAYLRERERVLRVLYEHRDRREEDAYSAALIAEWDRLERQADGAGLA